MSRHFHHAEASNRFGHPETARETVSLDGERFGSSADLRGHYIGAPPEVLLELALDALRDREKLVADLLRHVPRKFESKIKALDGPMYEARSAIHAAAILVENARGPLEPVQHPEAGQ